MEDYKGVRKSDFAFSTLGGEAVCLHESHVTTEAGLSSRKIQWNVG